MRLKAVEDSLPIQPRRESNDEAQWLVFEQTAEQTVELLVFVDIITLMWRNLIDIET